ncbi:death-on-curing protein [Paenibacillus sp. FSL A5-0031]|uniref:type II toxin-antitoxin system death-on-curing family toxin n=1 Tax=Paenibacillus sp. FSL A5-0031 TaxID=1920420 RepID=UPI00096DFB62|nr:type II toxin-antitoxin system death-on-curing family toxin [Paenibacillus sp. FSL A5-0031]OME79615.1 death-on-curing protein [Paenibacillus sp. FSL A5-0031]
MIIGLSAKQINMIHDLQLHKYGGLSGVKEPGYLELLAEKPFTEYFGEEQYPGLFYKAAVYFEGIAAAHAFNDGNKRTSVVVTYTFLQLNGYELEADWMELFETAISVAQKKMSLGNLSQWLEKNSKRI